MATLQDQQAILDLATRTNAPGYTGIDISTMLSHIPEGGSPPTTNYDPATGTWWGAAGSHDKKQQVEASVNQAEMQGAKLRASSELPQAANDIISNLQSQLKTIQDQSEGDVTKFAAGLAQMDSYIAMKKADFYNEAKSQAVAKYQVPQLKQMLDESIKQDDTAPGFRQKYGNVDSSQTESVRTKYMTAMNAADSAVNEILQSNPTYQSLSTYADTFKKTAEVLTLSNMEKSAQVKAQAEMQYNSYTPEQQQTLDLALGNTEKNPLMVVAKVGRLNAKGKQELNDVVENGSKAIVPLMLDGNSFARNVAIAKETAISGNATATTASIDTMINAANSNKTAMEIFQRLKTANVYSPTELKTLEPYVNATLGLAAKSGNAEERQAAANLRKDIVLRAAKADTKKTMDSDISSLTNLDGIQLPAFLGVARQNPAFAGKKISLDDAIAFANQAPTTQERQANIKALAQFYDAAIRKQNQSSIFTVDPMASSQLQAKAVLQGFNLFGKIADIPASLNRVFPPSQEALQTAEANKIKAQELADRNRGFLFGYDPTSPTAGGNK